jgi:hypothetical protein
VVIGFREGQRGATLFVASMLIGIGGEKGLEDRKATSRMKDRQIRRFRCIRDDKAVALPNMMMQTDWKDADDIVGRRTDVNGGNEARKQTTEARDLKRKDRPSPSALLAWLCILH